MFWIVNPKNTLFERGLYGWVPHANPEVNEILLLRGCFLGQPITPTEDIAQARAQFTQLPTMHFFEKLPTNWIPAALPLLRKVSQPISPITFRLLFSCKSLQLGAEAQYVATLGESIFPSLSEWIFALPYSVGLQLIPHLRSWNPDTASKFYKFNTHNMYQLTSQTFTPVSDPFGLLHHMATLNPGILLQNIKNNRKCQLWGTLRKDQQKRLLLLAMHQYARGVAGIGYIMENEICTAKAIFGGNLTSLLHVRLKRLTDTNLDSGTVTSLRIDPLIYHSMTQLSNGRWNSAVLAPVIRQFTTRVLQSASTDQYKKILIEYFELFRKSGITLEPQTVELVAPLFPTYHDYVVWNESFGKPPCKQNK